MKLLNLWPSVTGFEDLVSSSFISLSAQFTVDKYSCRPPLIAEISGIDYGTPTAMENPLFGGSRLVAQHVVLL
jgi:hypothetical protein